MKTKCSHFLLNSVPRLFLIAIILGACLVLLTIPALADGTQTFSGSVSFQSDAQGPLSITLQSFNTMGGTRALSSVSVAVSDNAFAYLQLDNDDPLGGTNATAHITRNWTGTGPGVAYGDTRTLSSSPIDLTAENDGGRFEFPDTDGTDWGGPLTWVTTLLSTSTPAPALYATPGPGLVTFTQSVSLPAGFIDWVSINPAVRYDLVVSNPNLTIIVTVTYQYKDLGGPGGPGGAHSGSVFPSVYGAGIAVAAAGVIGFAIYRRRSKA